MKHKKVTEMWAKEVRNMENGLTVEDVMKDLEVCETTAYRIFRRKDFPCNRLTRPFTIEKEAYYEWKKKRQDKEE